LDPRIPFSRSTSLSTATEPEIITEPPYGERSTAGQAADPEVVAKLTGHTPEQIAGFRKNGRI
jgi:hypothetical protein